MVIINEVVDDAKKRKKDCLIFKVDFEKAYDTINWNLLDYMIVRLGLGDKWRAWIKECVFRGELTVLINDVTLEEGLSGLVRSAVDLGIFKGYKVRNEGG